MSLRFPVFSSLPLALFGWAMVFVLLWWPVDHAAALVANSELRYLNLLASAAATLAAWSVSKLLPHRWTQSLLVLGLLMALCLRITHLGLIKFSGAGFTLEFFLHLEWQSVRLALAQYPWLAALLSGLLMALGALIWRLTRGPARVPTALAAGALMLALGLAGFSRAGLPEYQLLRAWQNWTSPLSIEIAPERLARWQGLPWLDTDIPHKRFLQAYAPERPLNLVLIYLESVGTPLIAHPRWPGLMPRLATLQSEHALLPGLHASSFITIEGLINSQCGSLLPFQRDSDTYASGERVFEGMSCLGDVLRTAGYTQSYLGGASMGFAGKGAFLSAHGYDHLLGYEHWQSLGMHARPGTWGLADADLFAQAEQEIARLRGENRPFNLTLLTIGTHLPGYRYEECAGYAPAQALAQHERDFLDALHCTDQLLGDFVDRLQTSGVLDDTLVIVTADHHVFPNPDMRALFDAAVDDRRLPLLALGPVRARPDTGLHAAGFDLAPTVLDLLGIRHNARFMLGRSLLQPQSQDRSYLPNRYLGVLDGAAMEPAPDCPPGVSGLQLPLNACDHSELLRLLGASANRMTSPPPRLVCDTTAVTGMQLDLAGEQTLEFWFAGEPQLRRFVWNSRPLQSARSGLYHMSIDTQGRVTDRQFLPADGSLEQHATLARHASTSDAGGLSLLAWLPSLVDAAELQPQDNDFARELTALLPRFQTSVAGAWWLRPGSGIAQSEVAADVDSRLELWLSPELCADALRDALGDSLAPPSI